VDVTSFLSFVVCVLVSVLQHVKELCCTDVGNRLVDKPGHHPRASQIDLSAQDINELCALLKASPNILHGERTMANDCHHFAGHMGVIETHLHCIVHLSTKEVFSLIVNRPWEDQGSGKKGDGAAFGLERTP